MIKPCAVVSILASVYCSCSDAAALCSEDKVGPRLSIRPQSPAATMADGVCHERIARHTPGCQTGSLSKYDDDFSG